MKLYKPLYKYQLIIIGYGDELVRESVLIQSFFEKILGFAECVTKLNSSISACHENNFYEFGPLQLIFNGTYLLPLVKKNVFVVNTSLLRSHSHVFVKQLIIDGLKWVDEYYINSKNGVIYGEAQYYASSEIYNPSYFFLLKFKISPKIEILNSAVNKNSNISDLTKVIERDFRLLIFNWVSSSSLRGWYGASYGHKNIRNNYRRKLVAMYYEREFSRLIVEKNISRVSSIRLTMWKLLDLLKNMTLKIKNRLNAYINYMVKS